MAIDPTSLDLVELDRATLTATAFDEADEALEAASIAWRSSDPEIVSVSAAGEVVAARAGVATITATIDGVEGEATVKVAAGVVARVVVTDAAEAVMVGRTVSLLAKAFDAMERPLAGRSPTWTSSNPEIAMVDGAGVVTGIAAGTSTITADVEGVQGHVTVEIAEWPAPKRVALGFDHACWLDESGAAWCWGANSSGQLGDGTQNRRGVPGPAAPGLTFRSLAAGAYFTCGVTDAFQVYCWGSDYYRQVGGGGDSATPMLVGEGPYVSVGTMHQGACAIRLEDGHPECWGKNSSEHELGNPSTEPSPVPVPVSLPEGVSSLDLVDFKGGLSHACGLSRDSRLYCWGYNSYGQVGVGNTQTVPGPVEIFPGQVVTAFGVGDYSTCATADGVSYCWGAGGFGQLGVGGTPSLVSSPTAIQSDGLVFTDFAGGQLHTCAIAEDGGAWCWGMNLSSQLGTSGFQAEVPVRVSGGHQYEAISVHGSSACAVSVDGDLYCWGSNSFGQLGIPGVSTVSVPTLVQW